MLINRLEEKRELSRLGIEPIYYPEGDFQAVKHLLGYIAEENNFISSFKSILLNNFSDDEISGIQLQIIVSLLKESFYCTALKYPQLLDMDNMKMTSPRIFWSLLAFSEDNQIHFLIFV